VDASVGFSWGWFGFRANNTTTTSDTQLDKLFQNFTIKAKYFMGSF